MISVILCIYKERLDWIKETILSIIQQTFTEFELIIISDNPDLDSNVKKYIDDLKTSDNKIKISYHFENKGIAFSRNEGIKIANGDYIAFIDGDDIWEKDHLKICYDYLVKNELDLVGSIYSIIDENSNIIGKANKVLKDINLLLEYGNYIPNSSIVAKKEPFIRLGGYRYFYNAEDYDLLLRLHSSEYIIGIVNEYTIRYRWNQKGRSTTSTNRDSFYYVRKLFFERKKSKYGEDSYSPESYKNYMNCVAKKRRRRNKCLDYINHGFDLLKRKNVFGFIFIVLSFFISFSRASSEFILRLKIMKIKKSK